MKRGLFFVLVIFLMFSLLPAHAAAGDSQEVSVSGRLLTAGFYAVDAEGGLEGPLDSAPASGGYVCYDGAGCLVLHDADVRALGASSAAISAAGDLRLILEGENTARGSDGSGDGSYGIYVECGTLSISGEGSLKAEAAGAPDAGCSAGIYVVRRMHEELGEGSYRAEDEPDSLVIEGGSVFASGGTADSFSCGVYADLTMKGGLLRAEGGSSEPAQAAFISRSCGVFGCAVVLGGELEAIGGPALNCSEGYPCESIGIYARGTVEISAGSVTARGGSAGNSVGVFAERVSLEGEGLLRADSCPAGFSCGLQADGLSVNGGQARAQLCSGGAGDSQGQASGSAFGALVEEVYVDAGVLELRSGEASELSEGLRAFADSGEEALVRVSGGGLLSSTAGPAGVSSAGVRADGENGSSGVIEAAGGKLLAFGGASEWSAGLEADSLSVSSGGRVEARGADAPAEALAPISYGICAARLVEVSGGAVYAFGGEAAAAAGQSAGLHDSLSGFSQDKLAVIVAAGALLEAEGAAAGVLSSGITADSVEVGGELTARGGDSAGVSMGIGAASVTVTEGGSLSSLAGEGRNSLGLSGSLDITGGSLVCSGSTRALAAQPQFGGWEEYQWRSEQGSALAPAPLDSSWMLYKYIEIVPGVPGVLGLSAASLDLAPGESASLGLELPEGFSLSGWSSDCPSVATVMDGLVSAHSAGRANILVTAVDAGGAEVVESCTVCVGCSEAASEAAERLGSLAGSVSEKLEVVRALGMSDLAEVLASDPGFCGAVAELEGSLGLSARIEAEGGLSGLGFSAVGAGLNAAEPSQPVVLRLTKTEGRVAQYDRALAFSLELENALPQLAAPILLRLNVPQEFDPGALLLLRELPDGSSERVEYTLEYSEGTASLSFIVTGPGGYCLAQAGGDICGAVIDGGRASVNVLSPGGLMICACFDAEGRMLSAETRPVTGLAGWQTLGFELPEGAARLSLMLLDGRNIPAAEGLSVDCA